MKFMRIESVSYVIALAVLASSQISTVLAYNPSHLDKRSYIERNQVSEKRPQSQECPDTAPASYSPQGVTAIDNFIVRLKQDPKVWVELKQKLDAAKLTDSYKEYTFGVHAATPPHRHDEVRKGVNISFPKGWVLLFLKADGTWTFDNKHKDVGRCGPEGFANRGAQGGALFDNSWDKFGQLVLCEVQPTGNIPGIIGTIYVRYKGLYSPCYNTFWDLTLLPFMNDLITDQKHYQKDNDGVIDCHVIVLNPDAVKSVYP